MARERQLKNKPPTPPEVAQAQEEAAVAALPPGLPRYLAYKPNEDTTVAFTQLNGVLSVIDQKLRTSNHVQPHTLMQEHVMPALLQLTDWFMRSHRDVVEYTQNLASWAGEQHMVVAMSAPLGNKLLESFKLVKDTVTEIKAMMSVEMNDESKAVVEAKLNVLADKASEMEHDVEEEDWDDEYPDEDEEEDEDFDDEGEDFDDDDDEEEEDEESTADAEPLL
jgi:hypothetical protein